MKWQTTTGAAITAPTRAAAEALATEYGMGTIVSSTPAVGRTPTLRQARRLWDQAQEWPRDGQQWPIDAEERAADIVLRTHFNGDLPGMFD
jgi:hypothetical protein